MIVLVCPFIYLVIRTYLFQGVLLALCKLVQVDDPFHFLHLGMQLVVAVFGIHDEM